LATSTAVQVCSYVLFSHQDLELGIHYHCRIKLEQFVFILVMMCSECKWCNVPCGISPYSFLGCLFCFCLLLRLADVTSLSVTSCSLYAPSAFKGTSVSNMQQSPVDAVRCQFLLTPFVVAICMTPFVVAICMVYRSGSHHGRPARSFVPLSCVIIRTAELREKSN